MGTRRDVLIVLLLAVMALATGQQALAQLGGSEGATGPVTTIATDPKAPGTKVDVNLTIYYGNVITEADDTGFTPIGCSGGIDFEAEMVFFGIVELGTYWAPFSGTYVNPETANRLCFGSTDIADLQEQIRPLVDDAVARLPQFMGQTLSIKVKSVKLPRGTAQGDPTVTPFFVMLQVELAVQSEKQ